MSEVDKGIKPKKAHPLDKTIQGILNMFSDDVKLPNTVTFYSKEGASELTHLSMERGVDKEVKGYLVHDGKSIKISVVQSGTFKPFLEIRFGEMFITSMAVNNKKALDLYLKGLYDKKPPKSKKNDTLVDV